jgi:hypothetical protein
MANVNLRNITNSFLDVRLASLASWKQANEISPRDRSGPYVVLQDGYDPEDPKVVPDEFVLGRSGKWISLSLFYRLPVPERRAEFIFGTAAEVIDLMRDLPPKVCVMRGGPGETPADAPAADDMAAAIQTAKQQSGGETN